MGRATQLLAYHGRTALLLGPMPRRASPPVANLSAAIRPLVDVSDLARSSVLKAAGGLNHPAHNVLLATASLPPVALSVRRGEPAEATPFRRLAGPCADGRVGSV